MRLCIIESPYAGDIERNKKYALACCRDSYERGEQPFASHLFYPQFMDDQNPRERENGIAFGHNFWTPGCLIAFYTDNGWSKGMCKALDLAVSYFGLFRFCQRRLYGHEPLFPVDKDDLREHTNQHLFRYGMPWGTA